MLGNALDAGGRREPSGRTDAVPRPGSRRSGRRPGWRGSRVARAEHVVRGRAGVARRGAGVDVAELAWQVLPLTLEQAAGAVGGLGRRRPSRLGPAGRAGIGRRGCGTGPAARAVPGRHWWLRAGPAGLWWVERYNDDERVVTVTMAGGDWRDRVLRDPAGVRANWSLWTARTGLRLSTTGRTTRRCSRRSGPSSRPTRSTSVSSGRSPGFRTVLAAVYGCDVGPDEKSGGSAA